MKKVQKSGIPSWLAGHVAQHPNDTWKRFCNNCPSGKTQIQQQLLDDQRGLCAYCENSMIGPDHNDLRVEHFYPKSPHQNAPNNMALEWQNMLGVCSGGNTRVHWDPSRFTSPDYSCDVPKDNKNLTGIILNPLQMPTPKLFDYDTSEANHVWIGADVSTSFSGQADASIRELQLNSPRLGRFRRAVFDALQMAFQDEAASGLTDQEAFERLAEAHFQPVPELWPAFFTMIRWFLGETAERRLVALGYQG